MARYIDADKLRGKREYCIERHEFVVPVCEIDWQPTEDVVPKQMLEQCENGYRQHIQLLQCKHKDELKQAEQEVARDIFEEIDKILKSQERYLYCNPLLKYVYELIEELKKGYLGE